MGALTDEFEFDPNFGRGAFKTFGDYMERSIIHSCRVGDDSGLIKRRVHRPHVVLREY